VLGGLTPATTGSVYINGRLLNGPPEEAVIVFQDYSHALLQWRTVARNVALGLEGQLKQAEIDERVREALTFVGLEETFSLYPSSLSGGMRRRVAIARAFIHHPELLLYDSPTGGLDPVTSTTIIELIVKERDVHRTPSLLVTHRVQDAFTLCTHHFDTEKNAMVPFPKGTIDLGTTFLMLDEGRLLFDGSLHDLVNSSNDFVREFLE